MRKFIFTILTVSVFFVGLGGLVDRAGARFKSDEKALTIIAQARQAIGGETAIKSVNSLTMTARTTQTLNFGDAPRTEEGDLEIALQLPNRFSKMLKIGKAGDGDAPNVNFIRQIDKVVIDDKSAESAPEAGGKRKIVIVNDNDENHIVVHRQENGANAGDNADTKVIVNGNDVNAGDKKIAKVIVNHTGDIGSARQNELFRTTFSLLLSAPEGTDANYTYVGEDAVDGAKCDVVSAQSGETSFKLFIDQSSHLPLMMSYQGFAPMVFHFDAQAPQPGANDERKVIMMTKDGQPNDAPKTFKVITKTPDAPPATAEFQVKFSDYRSTGGVLLPFQWTQTIDGKPDQTVSVANYEINPANIAEKFQKPDVKVMRMKKP